MANNSSLSHLINADPHISQPRPRQPSIHSISSAPGGQYTYPPPPSTVSPAASGASGTPHALATPATSPTATNAAAVATPSVIAPKGHAANTSLYQCADCLRRYSRPEHLQRHISTHTLGKRFVCQVCGKAFGRADLLKRHLTNHNDDGNGTKRRRINASPGAGRVAHACQACARARVKCEEVKPCTRCRNRNLACEYASEAGSAAAMHLLHLSANAHSSTSPDVKPQAAAPAPVGQASIGRNTAPSPRRLNSEAPSSRSMQPGSLIGYCSQATPAITNTAYSQTSRGSPPVMLNRTLADNEAAQLPTPETMIDQGHVEYQTAYPPGPNMVDIPGQQFGDFLQNVLYDQHQQQMDPSRMAVSQGLAVLDICDDVSYDLDDLDFGMLENWNLGNIPGMIATDPNLANFVCNQTADSADVYHIRKRLSSIWAESPWRWIPDGAKDNIQAEKSNLPLGDISNSQLRPDKVINDKLEPAARDGVLAIVLSVCEKDSILGRVAASFPSADVMDSLVHVFLAWTLCQVSEFIHFGVLSLSQQYPEWIAVAAAAGAILTPVQSLRKFGFALQEAVRVTIPNRFENNNSKIQNACLVQALVLGQDIGLWSGNRRRMEIAECHMNIPIAMIRGRGNFHIAAYPHIHVDPADEGTVLEAKWKQWCEKESWKRLIFHLYLRDAQISMTSMTNPHMSYAELLLPLPEARELWFSKSAQEWKTYYMQRHATPSSTLPSLPDLFCDFTLLSSEQHRLDVQYAISILLHGFWSMIREQQQASAIYRASRFSLTTNNEQKILLLQSRHAELVRTLEEFQLTVAQHMLTAQENLMLNLLLMHLHVSLEDLQLFSGKDGDEQAKRVYPALQRWVQGPDSRRAIWHAGQVLRWAKEFPPGHLKNFSAIAVHHAALALWTWGVVTRALKRTGGVPSSNAGGGAYESVVYIDGPESAATMQFVGYGTGKPVVRGPDRRGDAGPTEARVDVPWMCLDLIENILRANSLDRHAAPIVENLCHLMKQLSKAAKAVWPV